MTESEIIQYAKKFNEGMDKLRSLIKDYTFTIHEASHAEEAKTSEESHKMMEEIRAVGKEYFIRDHFYRKYKTPLNDKIILVIDGGKIDMLLIDETEYEQITM